MSLITACLCEIINLFVPNRLFFYPLKTSEKLTVFWYFQWVEKGRIECVKILIKKAWIAISVRGVFSSYQKRFKAVNYFWKALDLRYLKQFWICLRYLIRLRNTTFMLKRINMTAVGKQRFLIPWQTPNMWHVFTFFFNHSYWKRYILGKFCYQNWLVFSDFQIIAKIAKNQGLFLFFFSFSRNFTITFFRFDVKWKLTLITLCLLKCDIWENSGSWVMSQNSLNQSDCRTLKATSQEIIDKLIRISVRRYKFKKHKKLIVIF